MRFTDFLYGPAGMESQLKVNFFKIAKSILLYNKLILEYKNKGFGIAADMIKNEYQKQCKVIEKNLITHSASDFQRVASSLITIYRIFGRLVKQSDLCLERSMALTYALISLGIPANLIIGKAKYYINDNFQFHAWVEIVGFPLNDHDGMRKQWSVIYQLPKPNIST